MKRIEAVISPFKLDEVKERLAVLGVHGMTVSEVKGFGRQRGHSEYFRGAEYQVEFQDKIQVVIVANEDIVAAIVTAIVEAARTGKIGDGKIFVTPVEDVVRIRTGRHGEQAI